VPVILSLVKNPQVPSGPRKETSSKLKNNNAMEPIILKLALIFCVIRVGFYQILVSIVVKLTGTLLERSSMFNEFAAIFCFPCINF